MSIISPFPDRSSILISENVKFQVSIFQILILGQNREINTLDFLTFQIGADNLKEVEVSF